MDRTRKRIDRMLRRRRQRSSAPRPAADRLAIHG
jgi:hypothetical protein